MRAVTAVLVVVLVGALTAGLARGDGHTREDRLERQLVKERRLAKVERREAYRAGVRAGKRSVGREPSVREALALASFVYGVPYRTLDRLALCESRRNPRAVNTASGASGLLQFLPSTWAGNHFGRAGFSVFSPYANALGAAYHIKKYGTGAWECR